MTIAEIMSRARSFFGKRDAGQARKRQTRYTYTDGPMYYLGQQIVRAMQDAGYPAKIVECYRPPTRQNDLFSLGRSKARGWESPHQFYEAVDIVHDTRGWDVGPEFWDTLASCVRIVAERFGVDLEHGHFWTFKDSAHVELKDWRVFREVIRQRWRLDVDDWNRARMDDPLLAVPMPTPTPPTQSERAARFQAVLPDVWRSLPDVWRSISPRQRAGLEGS